ncbi:MAG: hypothetical protein A3D40_01835 [Parcubacteria group bacterium RIFCSPHIGHO2_02_FULL_40_12]|nr:MAG: hypothetical protein A3D40_01835 [Parcubacteria group bacterium RIFCSPHIGHO2_02_FULL_40_12]OHB22811.1 MAG: hypothetical protein A3I22_00490 [Parcubacteria group bacterium RIFCSPLOWO2_02_FULL_40_12]
MTEQEILAIYEKEDAVWFFNYNGDPKAPHAELTSGFCSDGYVNSAPVLADPKNVELLTSELVTRLAKRNVVKVDWIVGSAYAAITFSYELARQLGARHGFVEKDPANPKRILWSRLTIPAGSMILQCEELITMLGTTMEVRRVIQESNKEPVFFLPDVATAVYRPEKLQGGLIDVISLVAREVKTWEPDQCPLCAQGSERLRPRATQENWARLTGKA